VWGGYLHVWALTCGHVWARVGKCHMMHCTPRGNCHILPFRNCQPTAVLHRAAHVTPSPYFTVQEVQTAIEEAKQSSDPPIEDLWNNVYVDGLGAQMRPIEMGRPRIPV
jgi:hypothetical protein